MPVKREVLHIRRQGIRDRAVHRIDPVVGQFDDEVTGVVDDIRVIAIESGQDIRARSAIKHVRGHIARDPIGETVAGPIDGCSPRQAQEFNVRAQRRSHIAEHGIRPGRGPFDNRIARANDIEIVPCPTGEHVGPAVTCEQIVERIAGAVNVRRAREGECFEVCSRASK